MPSTIIFDRGQVVVVDVPFSNGTGVKPRPALIVSDRSFHGALPDVIVCPISSQPRYYAKPGPGDCPIRGLARPESSLCKHSARFQNPRRRQENHPEKTRNIGAGRYGGCRVCPGQSPATSLTKNVDTHRFMQLRRVPCLLSARAGGCAWLDLPISRKKAGTVSGGAGSRGCYHSATTSSRITPYHGHHGNVRKPVFMRL